MLSKARDEVMERLTVIDLPQALLQPIVIQVILLFGAQAFPKSGNPLVTLIFRLAVGHIRLQVDCYRPPVIIFKEGSRALEVSISPSQKGSMGVVKTGASNPQS